jgi:hypothetical protein
LRALESHPRRAATHRGTDAVPPVPGPFVSLCAGGRGPDRLAVEAQATARPVIPRSAPGTSVPHTPRGTRGLVSGRGGLHCTECCTDRCEPAACPPPCGLHMARRRPSHRSPAAQAVGRTVSETRMLGRDCLPTCCRRPGHRRGDSGGATGKCTRTCDVSLDIMFGLNFFTPCERGDRPRPLATGPRTKSAGRGHLQTGRTQVEEYSMSSCTFASARRRMATAGAGRTSGVKGARVQARKEGRAAGCARSTYT